MVHFLTLNGEQGLHLGIFCRFFRRAFSSIMISLDLLNRRLLLQGYVQDRVSFSILGRLYFIFILSMLDRGEKAHGESPFHMLMIIHSRVCSLLQKKGCFITCSSEIKLRTSLYSQESSPAPLYIQCSVGHLGFLFHMMIQSFFRRGLRICLHYKTVYSTVISCPHPLQNEFST